MVRYQPPGDSQQWVGWLAAGLHGRNRWRLSLVVMGIVFARGRRTVSSWLQGAERRADGIEHVEQHQRDVVVHVQSAIARPVTTVAHLVQPLEQRQHFVEVL